MTADAFRSKQVGRYTVRELSMRETLRILKEFPEGTGERGAALLGASVFNGHGEALGAAALDVGTGMYRALMEAYEEVNAPLVFNAQGGDDPGNG